MTYDPYRNRRHPPNKPRPAKPRSIKRQYHPPQRIIQRHGFADEREVDFRKPSTFSARNVILTIEKVTSLLEVIVILILTLAGSVGLVAILLAVHLSGTKAFEIILHVLKQKPL